MNRTDRLYALVEELRAVAPDHRSTTWLADRFEVSTRTIERDLSALQQSGVPIYATTGRRGGYAIDVQHTLPPLNLSAAEVAAIATALAQPSATPFTQAGRSALQKILAVLHEVATAVHFALRSEAPPVWWSVTRGITISDRPLTLSSSEFLLQNRIASL